METLQGYLFQYKDSGAASVAKNVVKSTLQTERTSTLTLGRLCYGLTTTFTLITKIVYERKRGTWWACVLVSHLESPPHPMGCSNTVLFTKACHHCPHYSGRSHFSKRFALR